MTFLDEFHESDASDISLSVVNLPREANEDLVELKADERVVVVPAVVIVAAVLIKDWQPAGWHQ
jgi:hypothetical protein